MPLALFVPVDLVGAAVRTGRHAEAAAHAAAMHDADIAALSPRLALLAGGSAAIAAGPQPPRAVRGNARPEFLRFEGIDADPDNLRSLPTHNWLVCYGRYVI